jgi:hypothetical protein
VNPPLKLALYAVGLAVCFGAAWLVGNALPPL